MLELAILGFLAERPLHGYELRRRIAALSGHARPVSDGSLYPAINRLLKAGMVEQHAESGTSAARRNVLSLTEDGRGELHRRLRTPTDHDISDSTRYFTVLAFLSQLPDISAQHAVLRRRLEFLEQPAGFFYEGDQPLRAEDMDDPYRRGMLVMARATSRAERAWLRETLA
ncbi:PadR family transcriptional regulator [Streptomyces sp. NPDC052051]|uniref:PadR family transcriptional regulator n=1 Tax=Streptomyces sp. NPDC052051 TaxID=3154649 RepID=UPI00341EC976